MNPYDSLDVATWSIEKEPNLLTVSTGYKRLFGYVDESVSDTPCFLREQVHPEDVQLFSEHMDKLMSGHSSCLEHRVICRRGEMRWVQSIGIPLLDRREQESNIIVRIDGVILDITERKTSQEQLENKHRLLEKMLDTIDVAICSYDVSSEKLSFISEALSKVTGYPLGIFRGKKTWLDNIYPEDIPLMEQMSAQIKLGIPNHGEYRMIHASGEIRWIQVRVIPSLNDLGEVVRLDCVVIDNTANKEIEKALEDRDAQYQLIADNMLDMMAVMDPRGHLVFTSPSCVKVLGYSEDVLKGTALFEYIHPEDQETLSHEMMDCIQKKNSWLMRYRIIKANNSIINMESLCTSVVGSDGEVESIVIVSRDITEKLEIERELKQIEERHYSERKKMEQALQGSEERYRRLVELSPIAIGVFKDGKVTYMNPAGARMLGEQYKGNIETNAMEWIHPDYHGFTMDRIEDTLLNGYCPPGDYQIIRADGKVVDVSLMSVYDPQSSSIQIMFEDISARKKAEEDRRFSEQSTRESEELHYRLQTSLDRFSLDLFGVMKVSQLERRLVREVKDVLKVTEVSVVEVDVNDDRLCKIIESDMGYYLKIGEIRGRSYLLCIEEKPAILQMAPLRVWLETITRYVSVLFDNFLLIEDLTKELEQTASKQIAPIWLSRLLFNLSENERKRLSQDLHDAALQEQIVWYRKLDLLMSETSFSGEVREQLEQIMQGLLDVIYHIRITCNELRPPMLVEEGLITSLEALFDFTQLRANYSIQFNAEHLNHTLDDQKLIALYRIVQELLANATKHSHATEVQIRLFSQTDRLQLEYEDNGVGMDLMKGVKDLFNSIGIYGIKERVRSMGGTIEFRSSENHGLAVRIEIPDL
ncbi:PAS domain S-box protein [Cohnella sp. WQ 127256]|uniref:PAS domain S-box protein n=1 Tax=Cohnella sp. WQ 127256 TaxID=2938790 RepID=UPI002117BCC2|nr:PAS domain S-box protein [Cohnella sp. WQ 127256]